MRSKNSLIILFLLLIAFLPRQAMAGNYTCPVTPGMGDEHYWQRLISGMTLNTAVSAEVSGDSLPVYRGPVRAREMPLPDKKKHLAGIFQGKSLLFFNPAQEGIAELISNLNSVSSKISGMAVGVSLKGLQAFLGQTRVDFPVSISPNELLSHLGVHTLPALVKITPNRIITLEGNIGAEHAGGRE